MGSFIAQSGVPNPKTLKHRVHDLATEPIQMAGSGAPFSSESSEWPLFFIIYFLNGHSIIALGHAMAL